MAENNGLYSIQGSTLTDIADAIRERSGDTQQYTPSEMAAAVLAIKGGGVAGLPSTLTYWSENENAEFGDISTPADTVKMASGKTLESVLAGCWIEFADKDGNPTTEPYIHWYSDPAIIDFSISETTYNAEEGMTWAEWVDSDYNADKTFGYSLEYSMVYNMDNQLISLNESGVSPTDVILANASYEIGVVPAPF